MGCEASASRHLVRGTNHRTPFARHRREDKGRRLPINGLEELTIFGAHARLQVPTTALSLLPSLRGGQPLGLVASPGRPSRVCDAASGV